MVSSTGATHTNSCIGIDARSLADLQRLVRAANWPNAAAKPSAPEGGLQASSNRALGSSITWGVCGGGGVSALVCRHGQR